MNIFGLIIINHQRQSNNKRRTIEKEWRLNNKQKTNEMQSMWNNMCDGFLKILLKMIFHFECLN